MAGLSTPELLVIAAVIASIVLLVRSSARLWPGVALAASALEAFLIFGVVSLSLSGFDLRIGLAAALVVAGGGAWLAGGAGLNAIAAAVVVVVGGVQLTQIFST